MQPNKLELSLEFILPDWFVNTHIHENVSVFLFNCCLVKFVSIIWVYIFEAFLIDFLFVSNYF